jgi:hypothetical protein
MGLLWMQSTLSAMKPALLFNTTIHLNLNALIAHQEPHAVPSLMDS